MWMVEWKEWDEENKAYRWNSDTWDTWEEVERIVHDCAADALCVDYRVSFFG